MEKPKTLLEALIKSREHWLDIIKRYPCDDFYGNSCPLCAFVRDVNGNTCGHQCVLGKSDGECDGQCCSEWQQCRAATNANDFIPAAEKMVARLEKEIIEEVIKQSGIPEKFIQKDEPKVNKPYQFQAEDVVKDTFGNLRVCLNVQGELKALAICGNEHYYELAIQNLIPCGYRKIGVLSDFLKGT